MKQNRLKLALGALGVAVCLMIGIWIHQATQRSQMERKADELIVAKTDELLLRLLRADEVLKARFGQYQSIEQSSSYGAPGLSRSYGAPWFTRTRIFDTNCIDFARLVRFAKGCVYVAVNIGYAANPELGRRSVRIDTWRFFQVADDVPHTCVACLYVQPILGEPDAPAQSNPPRVE